MSGEPTTAEYRKLVATTRVVPVSELSTVALINRVLHLCAIAGHDSLPFFGCVVCGDSTRLSTHVITGYGNVCCEHAEMYKDKATAETWVEEAAELDSRGIRRPLR